MKTPLIHRLASIAFATVLTAAMLAGVDALATSDAPHATLARVNATQLA